MDSLLQGLPHVVVHVDDILITGETEHQHLTFAELGNCTAEVGDSWPEIEALQVHFYGTAGGVPSHKIS